MEASLPLGVAGFPGSIVSYFEEEVLFFFGCKKKWERVFIFTVSKKKNKREEKTVRTGEELFPFLPLLNKQGS